MARRSEREFLQPGGFNKPEPGGKLRGDGNPMLRRTIGWLNLGPRHPRRARSRKTAMTEDATQSTEARSFRWLNATFIEVALHLGLVGFLFYSAYALVHPFLPVMVWSVVLTVSRSIPPTTG